MSLSDYKLVHSGGVAQVVTDNVTVGEVYLALGGQWCGSKANKKTKLFDTRAEACKWVAGCHMAMRSRLTA